MHVILGIYEPAGQAQWLMCIEIQIEGHRSGRSCKLKKQFNCGYPLG